MTELLTGGAGVLTGLIGTVLTTFMNLRAQKLKNQHEVEMKRLDIQAMIEEAHAQIQITETQVSGELEKMDASAYVESQKYGNQTALQSETLNKLFDNKWTMWIGVIIVMLLGFVEFLRTGIRPIATLYFTALTTWITYQSIQMLELKQQLLTVEMALSTYTNVSSIVIYLTVSMLTWWFGDRRVAKFLYRLNDGNAQN